MFIQTEETPNPNALKFFPGVDIINGDPVNLTNKDDAKKYKIAENLFEVQDIKGIMLGTDFISVTKDADADWEILKPQIFSIIIDFFTSGHEIEENKQQEDDDEAIDDISKKIKELIQTKVRPAVMEDGGNVIFKGYEDGTVYLKLQGACSGCPSASVTLKDGIENMLQYYVPEVQCVKEV
jgi:Fe-S cluster biogenesis protein NfuA